MIKIHTIYEDKISEDYQVRFTSIDERVRIVKCSTITLTIEEAKALKNSLAKLLDCAKEIK